MKSKILIRTLAAGAALLCAALPMQGLSAFASTDAEKIPDTVIAETTPPANSSPVIQNQTLCSIAETETATPYDDDGERKRFGRFTYVVNPDGSSVTIVDYNDSNIYDVEVPERIEGKDVTCIGDTAFAYKYRLEHITLPDTVKSIGFDAFYECLKLESINIPESVTSISSFAFAGCNHLRSINIPDGITILNDRTFDSCSRLTNITIPESVTSIGSLCFASCGLRNIIIPESVTEIKSMAFTGCTYLSNITIENASCSIYDAEKTIPSQATIHGKLKSTAHKYADKYNRKFIPTDSIWFLTQPKDTYGAVNDYVTFYVSTIGEVVRYQWQYYDTEEKKWVNSGLAGNKTPILTVKSIPSRNNMRYHCIIKDADGNKLISQPARLKVTPTIIVEPTDAHASVGEKVTFFVYATGAGLKYQWQYYDASKNMWIDSGLSGNKTKKLTVTAYAIRNGMAYRCVIRDENNLTLHAGPVMLYVN